MDRAPGKTTIFFDLDDTIVDTFSLLIAPLEAEAAEAIVRAACVPMTTEQLTCLLLEQRRRDPNGLRDALAEITKPNSDLALQIRDRIFSDFSVERLRISNEAVAILERLREKYRIVLISEGRAAIQNEKVRHMGIKDLFSDILILDPADGTSKEAAIQKYLSAKNVEFNQALIVGNRLDREILAGNKLGILTIWVRFGEGRDMERTEAMGRPDAQIDDITYLPEAIEHFDASASI